jgi:glycosyltransferase involved in cell wall biosynthesis
VILVWRGKNARMCHQIEGAPKLLRADDCIPELKRSFGRQTKNPIKKLYYRLAAARFERFEQTYFPRYDGILHISGQDAQHYDLPPSTISYVVSNGVDTQVLHPPDKPEKPQPPRVLFHGAFHYAPNAHAARFLAQDVGPFLAQHLGSDGFEIRVFGPNATPAFTQKLSRESWLTPLGYVDDLRRELADGTVYAAPIAMGGGVKNKVLDAMACGLPVVGTTEAFSGLDVTSGEECVICPIEKIPQEVLSLIGDPDRRAQLGRAARAWTVSNADWDAMTQKLEGVLESVVGLKRDGGEQAS